MAFTALRKDEAGNEVRVVVEIPEEEIKNVSQKISLMLGTTTHPKEEIITHTGKKQGFFFI